MNRYRSDMPINDGKIRKSAGAIVRIRKAMRSGNLEVTTRILKQDERLDFIAGQVYGDGRLWWVIAAASGIGWAPQAPAGTYLVIPTDLSQVNGMV